MFYKKIKKIVTIEGMMCEHCKSKVEKALLGLEDVVKVKISLKDKTATIYSRVGISDSEIKDVISNLGYKVINIGADK